MIWFPSAEALGAIRICVCGAFLVTTVYTSFDAIGRLPTTLMHPPGVMEYLGWKTFDRVVTPNGMIALKAGMIVCLTAGVLGLYTRASCTFSAIAVVFYQGILGSFGHACAESTVGMFCLAVLAFAPCGDAFSLDNKWRQNKVRPGWAYAYPILLMQLLLSWSYVAAGLGKLRDSGFSYFSSDTMPTHAVRNSLHNLHDTQFQFGLLLPLAKDFLPPLLIAIVLWEILFPLAVFSSTARRFFLVTGILFHLSTALIMNIIFVNQLAMYCLLLDWPNLIRRARIWRGQSAADTSPPLRASDGGVT